MKIHHSKMTCYIIDSTFLRYPFVIDQLNCPECIKHFTSRKIFLNMRKMDRFADFFDSELRNAFGVDKEPKEPGVFLIPKSREMTVLKCKNVDCGWWAIRMYTIYSTVFYHDHASDYLITMPISHLHEKSEYIDISWQDFFENDEHWIMSKSELSRDQSVLLFGEKEVRSKSCFDNPDKPQKVDYWRSHCDF